MQVLIYSIQTLLLHQNSFGLQYITKRMAQSQYQPPHGSAYQCGNACIYIYIIECLYHLRIPNLLSNNMHRLYSIVEVYNI
jgi:hypothetical protein